jgi:hypothetical protein
MRSNMPASKRRSRLSKRIALATAIFVVAALAGACSSSEPPIVTTGDQNPGGKNDAAVVDTGGVIFDAAQYLDGNDGANAQDASPDAIVVRDAAEEDSAPTDTGLVDVASLPDAASLDAYVGCAFLTCSPGCCNAAGQCVGGDSNTECGSSGNACQDCTSTSQTCQGFACQ